VRRAVWWQPGEPNARGVEIALRWQCGRVKRLVGIVMMGVSKRPDPAVEVGLARSRSRESGRSRGRVYVILKPQATRWANFEIRKDNVISVENLELT
jgi:hypothetical protein